MPLDFHRVLDILPEVRDLLDYDDLLGLILLGLVRHINALLEKTHEHSRADEPELHIHHHTLLLRPDRLRAVWFHALQVRMGNHRHRRVLHCRQHCRPDL